MADDLRPETNLFQRLLDRFKEESNAVAIAKVSVVVALLSLLMAFMALDNAKEANIRSELLIQELDAVKEEVEVLEVYVMNLEKKL